MVWPVLNGTWALDSSLVLNTVGSNVIVPALWQHSFWRLCAMRHEYLCQWQTVCYCLDELISIVSFHNFKIGMEPTFHSKFLLKKKERNNMFSIYCKHFPQFFSINLCNQPPVMCKSLDKTIKLWKVSERDKRPEGYNLKDEEGRLKDMTTITSLQVHAPARVTI